MRLSPFLLFLLLTASLWASACGPKAGSQLPTPDGEAPVATIEMEVEIVFKDGDGESVMMGRSDLFEEGHRRLEALDNHGCALAFDALWKALPPTDTIYIASLYNAGLCYENRALWTDASDRFQRVIDQAGPTRDGLDATFRLAESSANLTRWSDVERLMAQALTRADLKHLDRLEAMYRRGMSLLGLGRNEEAEEAFKLCFRENTLAGPAAISEQHYLIAGCLYGKAVAYHMVFAQLQFTLPEEQMERDLETKRQLSRRAYDQYLRTMRTKNVYWGMLSGYMIGKLFEDFYYDILTSEIPDGLSDQELADYFVMLREDARILLDEAITVYRKTSTTSEQINTRNDWVIKAEERLAFLERYYNDEVLLRREEAQVVDLQARLKRNPSDPSAIRRELSTLFRPEPAAPKLAPASPTTSNAQSKYPTKTDQRDDS